MSQMSEQPSHHGGSLEIWQCTQKTYSLNLWLIGAGPDGVEEIKRHRFFASIDWNVSTVIIT